MESNAKKTKLMTNNTSGINTEVKVRRQKLETVTSFKCRGSVITDEGSKPEMFSRIAQTTAALTRLKSVSNDRSISLRSKIRLMCSPVTSIFLYACDSWTLTTELQRRIRAMDMRCYRTILCISYKDHATSEEVRAKVQQAIEAHEVLLTVVSRRKLKWYGHVLRSSGLAKTISQGTVKVKGGRRQGTVKVKGGRRQGTVKVKGGRRQGTVKGGRRQGTVKVKGGRRQGTVKGGRRRGRQRKRWEDNIRE